MDWCVLCVFFSSRRRHTRYWRDWSSDVCSSDLGVPCNQFMGQEPGSSEEIAEFCSATYGVTFPMTEKVEVNGSGAHPLFQQLTAVPDADGKAGDVAWNFEKWVVSGQGDVVARLRPMTTPDAPEVRAAIESALG